MTQCSVRTKVNWEEYAEKLRRNTSNQSNGLNPLVQLLNFSYSNVTATNNNNNKAASQTNSETFVTHSSENKSTSNAIITENNTIGASQSASSLMRNFTTNKFNLVKFWQKNSVPVTVEETTPT